VRLAPLRPETVWRLDGDDLVETSGKRERRLPLAGLKQMRIAAPGAGGRHAVWLGFAGGRVTIASHSWAGPGRFEDRSDSFSALVRTLAARAADLAPTARFSTAEMSGYGAMTWAVGLLGAGVAVLLVFSLSAGAAGLGVTLAARLLFVLIMIFAVTPWLKPRAPGLDPRNLPRGLVP